MYSIILIHKTFIIQRHQLCGIGHNGWHGRIYEAAIFTHGQHVSGDLVYKGTDRNPWWYDQTHN